MKYCKNCKYFKKAFYGFFFDVYLPEECRKILSSTKYSAKNTPTGRKKAWTYNERIGEKLNIYNKNNDCRYYKKKWWKF